jgi:ABC-type antimicrobial peptide transport system permease subunit
VVRNIVGQLDAGGRIDQVLRLEDVVATSLVRPRVYAVLFAIFSALGLIVATIGVYGVISYAVAQSTRELGVRLALGAQRSEILAMVLWRAGVLAGTGIALGLFGALALTRSLQGMLFGLTPLDPQTYIAAAVLFATVALFASYLPARRATTVNPVEALRAD